MEGGWLAKSSKELKDKTPTLPTIFVYILNVSLRENLTQDLHEVKDSKVVEFYNIAEGRIWDTFSAVIILFMSQNGINALRAQQKWQR